MRDSLKQELSGIADHWKIIIRVYANISGLGRTYVESGVIANDTLWKHFVHGFNRSSQWHEFVDAGRDKEAADNRIKGKSIVCSTLPWLLTSDVAYFELFHPNQHCKRIVLGVSGDNSYAGFLRDHITGNGTVPGLALLEALPFPITFREIAAKNTTFKLDAVFRTEKLQIQAQNSNGPARDSKVSTSNVPATYANMAQATQVGINVPPQARVVESRAVEQPALTTLRQSQLAMPKKIQFNINGHRIDERIVPDASQMAKLKKLKLCNRHFLTQCAFEDCKHSHNCPLKLDKKAIDTLRFIARLSQCRDKYCDDILCVSGHQCPYSDQCLFGRNCHFDPDKHGMDKKVDETKTIHLTV